LEKIGKDWKLFLKFKKKGIYDSGILPWLIIWKQNTWKKRASFQ